MKRAGILNSGMLILSCLGMILPAPILQAAVDGSAPAGTDVQLRQGGMLWGQVIDSNGNPLPGTAVLLRHRDRDAATTMTDQSGYFLSGGLRGGTYEIIAGEARGMFRLWTPNTAPPTARPGALLVAGGEGVRGQCGPIAYWLGNPWVVAGIVAAAVAIPVAIHNNRIHRSASP